MFALERQPCSAPKVLNPITRIPIEFDSRRKMSFYSEGNAMHNNTLPSPVALRVWTSSSSSSFSSPSHISSLTCHFLLVADCVYIESRRPNTPYFICSIQDFKLVSASRFPTSCHTADSSWFFMWRACAQLFFQTELLLKETFIWTTAKCNFTRSLCFAACSSSSAEK